MVDIGYRERLSVRYLLIDFGQILLPSRGNLCCQIALSGGREIKTAEQWLEDNDINSAVGDDAVADWMAR